MGEEKHKKSQPQELVTWHLESLRTRSSEDMQRPLLAKPLSITTQTLQLSLPCLLITFYRAIGNAQPWISLTVECAPACYFMVCEVMDGDSSSFFIGNATRHLMIDSLHSCLHGLWQHMILAQLSSTPCLIMHTSNLKIAIAWNSMHVFSSHRCENNWNFCLFLLHVSLGLKLIEISFLLGNSVWVVIYILLYRWSHMAWEVYYSR